MIKHIKVLIAEEHFYIRQGLRQVITGVQTLQLSGEAETIEELRQLTSILQPHVVVTGIDMTVINAPEPILQLAAHNPAINIIVFSNCAEAEVITGITEAGASGYVMKSSHGQQMINAIEAVHRNRNYYCNNTLQVLKPRQNCPASITAQATRNKALPCVSKR